MKVIRNVQKDGNICTPLFTTLTLIKDKNEILFFNEHRLRHPLGICSVSEDRFFMSLRDLSKYLNENKELKIVEGDNTLFIKTKEVIESIVAYLDDMYLIFKCFYPSKLVLKEITFASRWLSEAGCKESENFKKTINGFLEPYIVTDNVIKHNHGRIGILRATENLHDYASGFFVEGVENGVIIPNEKIHPKFMGKSTAFSYNRFILDAFSNLYLISYYADRTLKRILKEEYNFILDGSPINIDSSKTTEAVDYINQTLTSILFEDEYKKCSQVELVDGILTIRTPADKSFIKSKFKGTSIISMRMIISSDGITRSWRLPYM